MHVTTFLRMFTGSEETEEGINHSHTPLSSFDGSENFEVSQEHQDLACQSQLSAPNRQQQC